VGDISYEKGKKMNLRWSFFGQGNQITQHNKTRNMTCHSPAITISTEWSRLQLPVFYFGKSGGHKILWSIRLALTW
jgi:hypothetical protein